MMRSLKQGLSVVVLILLLLGAGYLIKTYRDAEEQKKVERTEIDSIVVALREKKNRLEVYTLSGWVTTSRERPCGIGGLLSCRLTIKQPYKIAYFVDLKNVGLDDYKWDRASRTLTVRAPLVSPDPPNLDASRQVTGYRGVFISRRMQTDLRQLVAIGAAQQVSDEAGKSENLLAANKEAEKVIEQNFRAPLIAAGLGPVTVRVVTPNAGIRSPERWDVSPSIEQVLADRADPR